MAKFSRNTKVITLLLIMVLLVSVFTAACSSRQAGNIDTKQSDSSQATVETGNAAESTVNEQQPYTVKMWMFPLGDSNKQKEVFDGIVEKFETANPNIKVNIQTMPWSNREQN